MSYEKQVWKTDDIIIAPTLNHIEDGIEKCDKDINDNKKNINVLTNLSYKKTYTSQIVNGSSKLTIDDTQMLSISSIVINGYTKISGTPTIDSPAQIKHNNINGFIISNGDETDENIIDFSLTEPLRASTKNSDVKDTLDIVNGTVTRKILAQTFKGNANENWILKKTNESGIVSFLCDFTATIKPKTVVSNMSDNMSDYYSDSTTEFISRTSNGVAIAVGISSTKASTVEEFRQWLSQNNIKIIAERETPILETVDIDADSEIMTFEGNTQFSYSGSGATNTFSVKCIADPTDEINSLKNAIISLGGNI